MSRKSVIWVVSACSQGFRLGFFKHVKESSARRKLVLGLAPAILLGIILLPAYFRYDWNVTYLLIYLGIILAYAIGYVWLTFSRGALHDVHPKGQTSIRLRALIPGSE